MMAGRLSPKLIAAIEQLSACGLRVGQMTDNVLCTMAKGRDLFYLTDDELADLLIAYRQKHFS